jgi:antitoxin component YwqK of YwqJK toxin-antitoxin module
MAEGSRNGQYKTYDRQGNLILEGNFLNGQLHGDNIGYYPAGGVQHRFTYKEGKKIGTNYEYYPNGEIKTKEIGTNNGNDLTQLSYDENRTLQTEKKFRNEKPHGTWTIYFPGSKVPRIKETYDEGNLTGIRYTYHENGKIAHEESYKFNLLAGPFTTYFENGQLESSGEYRNNRKHGLFTAYYPSGKIREQGEYVADRKHKEWKEFDEEGNLKNALIFRAGTLVTPK